MSNKGYKGTLGACYLGYITQAIVVNLSPIFFVIFREKYGLDTGQIGNIILVLFLIQLLIDMAAAWFVDIVGYRICAVFAHVMAAAGLILLGILPVLVRSTYAGIMIAVTVGSVGSGLIELLISPIVDRIPSDSKSGAMSLLHACYCWGQVAVVAISTLSLGVIGHDRWYILPILWAALPLVNSVFFCTVHLSEPVSGGEKSSPKKFIRTKTFVLAAFVMLAAAMAEMSISQWASYFAERGLGVRKIVGDLLGPCMFGICMAVGRTAFGLHGAGMRLGRVLASSAVVCAAGYFLCVFSPHPVLSLAGCGISGIGVSLLWPGTLSFVSERIPGGGTMLFALLALFGDLGCSVGPWLTGVVSDLLSGSPAALRWAESAGIGIEQMSLKAGLLLISVFPLTAAAVLRVLDRNYVAGNTGSHNYN